MVSSFGLGTIYNNIILTSDHPYVYNEMSCINMKREITIKSK